MVLSDTIRHDIFREIQTNISMKIKKKKNNR